MSYLGKLIISLIILMLAACGGAQLYHQQLVNLDKGISPERAAAVLQQAPSAVYDTVVDGNAYKFYRYYLNNGRLNDTYLLCFEGDKLKYWGYIEEFRRYPDPRINRATEDVLVQMKAEER